MPKIYTGTFAITPNLPITINHDKANALPADIVLDLNVGLSSSGSGATYEGFYLELRVENPIIEGVDTPLILFSGDIPSDPQNRIEIFESPSNETSITLQFADLDTVVNGNYSTQLTFLILGKSGETYSILSSVTDQVRTNVTGVGTEDPPIVPLGIVPENLSFTHAQDKALPPSQNVVVESNGPFKVSVMGPVVLSGPSLTLTQIVNGVKEYAGTEAQTVAVSISADVINEPSGVHEYLAVFMQTGSNSALIGSLGITLYLFENSNLVIFPTALEFFAIKEIQEAPSQTLTVAGYPAWTLSRPSWLNVSPSSGQGFTEVTVTPNTSDLLDEGEYNGDIVINDGINDFIIPVLHNVYGNVQLGVKPNKINFTNDYDRISKFYEQINYKLLLNLDVDFFNYGSTLLNQTSLAYVLGFFNFRTQFFLGQTLNNIMKELLQLQSIRLDNLAVEASSLLPIRNYYLPASTTITAVFKHDFDELLDKTYTYEGVKFIKGRRPKTPFDDTFILDYYRDPLRVTVNSVAMFNFYKEKNHIFRIYKNGMFDKSISHSVGTQRIFGYKLVFDNYNQGDVVEVRLYKNLDGVPDENWFNTNANFIGQKYILIPEGKETHHIGYEDEHGLLKILEFTGSISFENAYENTIAKNYEDFLETLKKLDSKKTRKVTINTGVIFKVNTKNIDALLGSKRAWILSEDNKKSISMIPTNKTMTDEDSDQDLYAYDIEFDINFNNDFEINT